MMNDKIELKATKLPDEINAICCVACGHVSERPLMAAEGEAEGEDHRHLPALPRGGRHRRQARAPRC